jgi:hypothetical protein
MTRIAIILGAIFMTASAANARDLSVPYPGVWCSPTRYERQRMVVYESNDGCEKTNDDNWIEFERNGYYGEEWDCKILKRSVRPFVFNDDLPRHGPTYSLTSKCAGIGYFWREQIEVFLERGGLLVIKTVKRGKVIQERP